MRVIYLNFFSRHEITGGIKIAYRCAELLKENGVEALVWQPDGVPTWFETATTVVSDPALRLRKGDILIFPEILREPFLGLLRKHPNIPKVLFCQNPYNLLASEQIPEHPPYSLGFSKILCVSHVSRDMIARTFGYDDVAVMPIAVDDSLFRPAEKVMRIAYSPRKLPRHAEIIRRMFRAKYPDAAHIPWQPIEGMSETRAAEIMGTSQVFLALGQFESCPLLPLEAMSAGCVVVGYHGYGGLEYATPRNGFWHFQDEVEEVVDDLYRAVTGISRQDPVLGRMIKEGAATAERFSKKAMLDALIPFLHGLAHGSS